MKSKIINGSGSVIALFYTLLMILVVDGIERAGIINGAMDLLGFENGNAYGVLLFILCVVLLIFYYIVMSKGRSNAIAMMLITSFIIGVILLVVITQVTLVQKYFFNFYISWFYHGVYFEGEEKVQQVFSYISRLVALCFWCGGVISAIFVKFIKRNLIKA